MQWSGVCENLFRKMKSMEEFDIFRARTLFEWRESLRQKSLSGAHAAEFFGVTIFSPVGRRAVYASYVSMGLSPSRI